MLAKEISQEGSWYPNKSYYVSWFRVHHMNMRTRGRTNSAKGIEDAQLVVDSFFHKYETQTSFLSYFKENWNAKIGMDFLSFLFSTSK